LLTRSAVGRSALDSIGVLLEREAKRWLLFGDLAANRYRAQTQLTGETELLVESAAFSSPSFGAVLEAQGWGLYRVSPDGDVKRFMHREFGCADLIVQRTAFEQDALSRAAHELLPSGLSVPVPSREDAILCKLIAGRARDLADIESILDSSPALDEAYIERHGAPLGLLDTWRKLLTASRA